MSLHKGVSERKEDARLRRQNSRLGLTSPISGAIFFATGFRLLGEREEMVIGQDE